MLETIFGLPSLSELLVTPSILLILAMYVGLLFWEDFSPAQHTHKVTFWQLKGIFGFILFFVLSSYFPQIWYGYLGDFRLIDLSHMGAFGEIILGIVLYEFGFYIWHRVMHKSKKLWKIFHKMHHSAERLDGASPFYLSTIDMLGFTFLGSLCLVVTAGFSPEAATLIILIITFFSIFRHCNIKTPMWMGYFIQRPESHVLHHIEGAVPWNYCDLSIVDMLFGTFKHPEELASEKEIAPKTTSMVLSIEKANGATPILNNQ